MLVKIQEFKYLGVACNSLALTLGWSLLKVYTTIFLVSFFQVLFVE